MEILCKIKSLSHGGKSMLNLTDKYVENRNNIMESFQE